MMISYFWKIVRYGTQTRITYTTARCEIRLLVSVKTSDTKTIDLTIKVAVGAREGSSICLSWRVGGSNLGTGSCTFDEVPCLFHRAFSQQHRFPSSLKQLVPRMFVTLKRPLCVKRPHNHAVHLQQRQWRHSQAAAGRFEHTGRPCGPLRSVVYRGPRTVI